MLLFRAIMRPFLIESTVAGSLGVRLIVNCGLRKQISLVVGCLNFRIFDYILSFRPFYLARIYQLVAPDIAEPGCTYTLAIIVGRKSSGGGMNKPFICVTLSALYAHCKGVSVTGLS